MKIVPSILAALAVVACQPAGSPAESSSEGTVTAPADRAAQDGTNPQGQVISLDSEGLRLVDEGSGTTRLIPFGTPREEAMATISRIAGPAIESGNMDECGPGPLAFVEYADGLRLWFSQGGFSGWESTGDLSTMDGLSAATDRSALQASGITEFTNDTLGEEFESGGIYGILEPDGQEVALLHVGDNCFMR